MDHYRMINQQVVPLNSESELEEIFDPKNFEKERKVAVDLIEVDGERYRISTEFLVVNRAGPGEEPILFETNIFATSAEPHMTYTIPFTMRYSTFKEAAEKHQKLIKLFRETNDFDEAISRL